jgi:Flp pilus assembly protein TadD/nitrate/TMAO reductase-like tetraheme cytochrome c subunit
MKKIPLIGVIIVSCAAMGIAAILHLQSRPGNSQRAKAAAVTPTFVGAASCKSCHAAEVDAWRESHHALSMQHANEQTVLGNFDNARYEFNGVPTTFSRRDGHFFVNTDGPDGRLTDYEVRYTFGVAPLQQYLVEFPLGRLQALPIAWDSRPAADGGQRWFHLYPKEKIDHKDELHWTRLSQNWNYMCAECHSTNLQKNYDVANNRFKTTWSEINVACEACHGPASQHVAWARKIPAAEQVANKGLVFLLNERKGADWVHSDSAKTATRIPPRVSTIEIDTCARCHSRRSTLTEDYQPGKSIMATHLPALLTQPFYHPDGQIKEEDYEYGSFLQSKMFHEGVTCSDCHEPHSLKLRAPGNQTCLQCHDASTFDTEKHHFHPLQSRGALCAECHMPTTKFMVIHARHDHSIRIPRPDLSMKLNTPNACNNCHSTRSAEWAKAQMDKWYGKEWSTGWHFGGTMFDAQRRAPQVGQDLVAIAVSPQVADIARATATTLLPSYLDPTVGAVLPSLLSDRSPMVRRAALGIVEAVPPPDRLRLAAAMLLDPVLAVRTEAARVLAAAPRELLDANQQQALDDAIHDYILAALANAEHPQSHVNLGLLYTGMGQFEKAEKAYRQAITLDPTYAIAYVNLADLYRQQQRDDKVEATLLSARAAIGDNAAIEHSLGLQYVRAKQMPQALAALAKASQLDPNNARYAYVYAVALDGSGETARAIGILQGVHARYPFDRDVLLALANFNKAQGNLQAAKAYARKLLEMEPRYGSVEQILQ